MHATRDTNDVINSKGLGGRVMRGVMLLPLSKNMKCRKLMLAVLALCAAFTLGQGQAPKQPAEWSLRLETGGAPFEKKFEVDLNQSGKLVMKEEDPGGAPGERAWGITRDVPPKDARKIYDQVLRAFREFRFADEDVKRHDGTNLTLRLRAYGRVLVMQFFHMGRAEEECPEVGKVLSLINKHLPQEHHVY
jgi:hypothetical protein